MVEDLRFRDEGLGFRVYGLGFKVFHFRLTWPNMTAETDIEDAYRRCMARQASFSNGDAGAYPLKSLLGSTLRKLHVAPSPGGCGRQCGP